MAEKTLLEVKVEESIGALTLIYAQADTQVKGYIVDLVKDSKELLEKYDDLKKLANDIVDILDNLTQTGLADAVDGPILKTVLGFIITKKAEEWYDKARLELINKIDAIGQ